ncbi:MAG: hypothetical protein IPQ17_07270 [Xanthomonadales bacterium]|nr:hypothetical protein [Xanthomonadales bacterium]
MRIFSLEGKLAAVLTFWSLLTAVVLVLWLQWLDSTAWAIAASVLVLALPASFSPDTWQVRWRR